MVKLNVGIEFEAQESMGGFADDGFGISGGHIAAGPSRLELRVAFQGADGLVKFVFGNVPYVASPVHAVLPPGNECEYTEAHGMKFPASLHHHGALSVGMVDGNPGAVLIDGLGEQAVHRIFHRGRIFRGSLHEITQHVFLLAGEEHPGHGRLVTEFLKHVQTQRLQ